MWLTKRAEYTPRLDTRLNSAPLLGLYQNLVPSTPVHFASPSKSDLQHHQALKVFDSAPPPRRQAPRLALATYLEDQQLTNTAAAPKNMRLCNPHEAM